MDVPCGEAMPTPEPFSILVVEDETLIRMMIAEDLREAGFKTIEAGNVRRTICNAESDGGWARPIRLRSAGTPKVSAISSAARRTCLPPRRYHPGSDDRPR
jgi:CheY-like chemotaxis protein